MLCQVELENDSTQQLQFERVPATRSLFFSPPVRPFLFEFVFRAPAAPISLRTSLYLILIALPSPNFELHRLHRPWTRKPFATLVIAYPPYLYTTHPSGLAFFLLAITPSTSLLISFCGAVSTGKHISTGSPDLVSLDSRSLLTDYTA